MTITQIRGLVVNEAKVVNATQLVRQLGSIPDWYRSINRVSCPSGADAGIGRFLILRSDFDTKWPESSAFDIVMQRHDGSQLTTTTLKNYVTVSAFASLRAQQSHMVVEVADARYLLKKIIIHEEFNVEGDSSSTWADVLTQLKTYLSAPYGTALAFATSPTYALSNLRYEGVSIVDALADVAHRTGHTLVYDPLTANLRFEDMTGPQADSDTAIAAAKLHRDWEMPETVFSHEIGKVVVGFDLADSTLSEVIEKTSGASTNMAVAWGTTLKTAANSTETDDEATALAQTWFDWSTRADQRVVREFFGALGVKPGSKVSSLTWFVGAEGTELFTIVEEGAPPCPKTMRPRPQGGTGGGDLICYAVAPSGGLDPLNGASPSYTDCEKLTIATNDGLGYVAGDFVLSGDAIEVRNWNNETTAADGSRLIQIADHGDGTAELVGYVCSNESDAFVALADESAGWWSPSKSTGDYQTATLSDTSPLGNSATLNNMTPATDWVSDTGSGGVYAIDLDGTDDYVEITGLSLSTTAMTVAIWFKTSDSGTYLNVIAADATTRAWAVRIDSSGNLEFFASPDGGTSNYHRYRTSGTDYRDGAWHHVAATFDNGVVKIFADGNDEPLTDTGVGSPAGVMQQFSTVHIGARVGTTVYNLAGRFDGARLFNRVLSAAEVAILATDRMQ